jgi:hypothetical protein
VFREAQQTSTMGSDCFTRNPPLQEGYWMACRSQRGHVHWLANTVHPEAESQAGPRDLETDCHGGRDLSSEVRFLRLTPGLGKPPPPRASAAPWQEDMEQGLQLRGRHTPWLETGTSGPVCLYQLCAMVTLALWASVSPSVEW